MPFCTFSKESGLYDSTPIENLFLTEYLPTAPADCLRVYLCLRMLALHPELGLGAEELPDMLRMKPAEVDGAVTYWEREGLLLRTQDNPPAWQLVPMRLLQENTDPMEKQYYASRNFNASLQALFGMENLLHPKQYAMANDWVEVFGLSREAVVALVEEALKKGSKKPDRLFKRLDDFIKKNAERGMRTVDDVLTTWAMSERTGKVTVNLLTRLGIRREPTLDELHLVHKWMSEWLLTESELLEACAETVKSRNPSMAYLDSILASRREDTSGAFLVGKQILAELGQTQAVPSPSQLVRIRSWLSAGFEPDTLKLAAVQAAQKNKRTFEGFEWALDYFRARGLLRAADAEADILRQSALIKDVHALLLKAGLDRRPLRSDMDLYAKWTAAFPIEVIECAAELALGKPNPTAYMDKVLTGWAGQGISTRDAALAAHAAFTAAAVAAGPAGSPRAPYNPALDYDQRAHTESDFSHLEFDLDSYDPTTEEATIK